jgi:hypothetical protein
MSLVDRMVVLNARLTSIPIRLGVKQHRNLLVRHACLYNGLLADFTDTLLAPKPYIETVPERMIGLSLSGGGAFNSGLGVTIAQDDFLASNIPRSYSLEFLREGVQFFVIDPVLDEMGAASLDLKGNPEGITCKCVHIDDKDLLTWTLILRKVRDHYTSSSDILG